MLFRSNFRPEANGENRRTGDPQQQMNQEEDLAKTMLDCRTWAVIGANRNPAKYGYMIFNKLKRHGYRVYPVNPNYETIDGERCHASLSDLPETPEVIVMVVAPRICERFLNEAAALHIPYVWLQPGTHDQAVLQLVGDLGLTAIQACVLVALR